jgi:hypothetical protein
MTLQVLNLPRDEAGMTPMVSRVFTYLAGIGVNPEPDAMCGVWATNFLKVIASTNEQKEIDGLLLLACGENYVSRERNASVLGLWGNDQAGMYALASTVAQALGRAGSFVKAMLSPCWKA